MSPYESRSYVKVEPKDTEVYDQVLAKWVKLNNEYKMVMGMIMKVNFVSTKLGNGIEMQEKWKS